ncbi:uncharacterized protein LOC126892034 isoform X1 [Diabrotica virgifera virgifera]|uniref:G-protein coupled receptors family 1 profile domain-containing protein n=2 Tax=Diabrotica virgifera virgifera TaxID=50390 RepID=A0ABM5L4P1_DIAVI|nr:uncharacterized protein LOC126892034 isoform X1 [Diabrotica virgifera virgifera]
MEMDIEWPNSTENVTYTTTHNISDLDAEEFDYYNHVSIFYKIYIEIYTFLAIICIVANILLIFVILKYRRLRYDKENIIILNWCVLNTFFMLTQPQTFRFSFYWTGLWSHRAFCILEQAEFTALFGDILFIVLLFIFWFCKLYYPAKYVKLANHVRFAVIIVYFICLCSFSLHIYACFNRKYMRISELVLWLMYLIFVVFMIVMNVVHLVKRRKFVQTTTVSNIPLILCNVYFSSIILLIFTILINITIDLGIEFAICLMATSMLLSIVTPIYFFLTLYRYDKNYNTFLGYVLTCQCNKYGKDEFQEEPVVFNGTVQMS